MADQRVKAFARAFADVFFPRFCIVCQAPISHDNPVDLCGDCEKAIALPEGHYCAKCAAPMGDYATACPNCHGMHLVMNASAAFGIYDGALRDRVIEFKFSSQRYMARTFGILVARAARKQWPDVAFDAVTAVALHPGRRRERGFDQSKAIARYTAKSLGVPYMPGLLTRVRATESQVGLTRNARMDNVKGAFQGATGTGVKSALVVDDIMTTGATLSEAARALKRAGVKKVFAAVVARTGPDFVSAASDQPADMEGQTR